MKTQRNFLSILFLILFTISCSKETPPQSGNDLNSQLKFLPASTVLFGVFDMQDAAVKAYMNAPGYRKYMSGVKLMMASNPLLSASGSGMQTYLKVTETIGFMPKEGEDFNPPFKSGILFATADKPKKIDVALKYEMQTGHDPKSTIEKLKTILQEGKINFQNTNEAGFDILSIKPFEGTNPNDPMTKIYHETLGINELFLIAKDNSFIAASDKKLLIDLLNNSGGGTISETPRYIKTMAALDKNSSNLGFGYADLDKLILHLKGDGSPIYSPIPAVAFGFTVKNDSCSMNLVAPTEPKDPMQESLITALSGATKGASLATISSNSAMAIAFDGGVLLRVSDVFTKNLPANPFAMMAKDMLSKISGISIGFLPASGGSPFPNGMLTISSEQAQGLYTQIKPLLTGAPLPEGMKWQTKSEDGVAIDSLPTPFGVGVYIASSPSMIVVNTNETELKQMLKGAVTSTPESSVIAQNSREVIKAPILLTYFNYSHLAAILQNTMTSMAMFAPSAAAADPKQFEYMKYVGEVILSAGFDSGVLRINFGQQWAK